MFKKISAVLLIATLLSIGSLGFAAGDTFAATYYCDNDRAASMYPYCDNTYDGAWEKLLGYSGDANRDSRLTKGNSGAQYFWRFWNIQSGEYNLNVWLANYRFTNTCAEYAANTDAIHSCFDQNSAAWGWNSIWNKFITYGSPLVEVNAFNAPSSSSGTGADLVRIIQASTLSTTQEKAYHSNPEVASIQKKMLNAIDNYKDIQGSFRIKFANINQDERVDFMVSEDHAPGSYVKITPKNGTVKEHKSNGKTLIQLNHETKTLRKQTLAPVQKVQGPRHFTNQHGEPVYVHRQDPADAHAASKVTFPQNYAFWLKNPENKVVGHEKLLQRNVTVIEGKHDAYMSKKLGAVTYKMWVDTKTGVLLKLSGKDANGKEVYSIHVTDIKFDQGVDKTKFSTAEPLGWKNLSQNK
ncbi:hypothetical protein [Lihuaxuella thermophila]|uniref:Uncharacterized protein n=1 Tax=Lihuaxuella thermophila TaxID=1173111 RepID=A0A1H8CHM7_9BACL|nr:hypothetical protein [Lihuaxuella thermophila]SEM94555.1 hypothetical protein SAMN05444955_103312 [Lihuaxuella thermophila]